MQQQEDENATSKSENWIPAKPGIADCYRAPVGEKLRKGKWVVTPDDGSDSIQNQEKAQCNYD